MASETLTLTVRRAWWLQPVLWSLVPFFLVVGERVTNRVIEHIATRAIHVR